MANQNLWMACHERLATKDILNQFGMLHNATCYFCREKETLQHLMFSCTTMSEIWMSVLSWPSIKHIPKGWKEEFALITCNCQRKCWKVNILKCAFAETIYEVWKYMNNNCFGNKTRIQT